jgi:hypothetical protein
VALTDPATLPVPVEGTKKPGVAEDFGARIQVLRRRQNLVPRHQQSQYVATFEGQVFVGNPNERNPGRLLTTDWYDKKIRTTLLVRAVVVNARHEQALEDIYHNDHLGLIRNGTSRLLARFQFRRPPAIEGLAVAAQGEGTDDRLLVESVWHPVEPIEEGTNYIIRLKLTPEEADRLRAMVEEAP